MKKREYIIRKTTSSIVTEEIWSSIRDGEIKTWIRLSSFENGIEKIEKEEEINEETERLDEQNGTINGWELGEYSNIISKEEYELLDYFEENNIKFEDKTEDFEENKYNAYGVEYTSYYLDLIFKAELNKNNIRDLENMGCRIEKL